MFLAPFWAFARLIPWQIWAIIGGALALFSWHLIDKRSALKEQQAAIVQQGEKLDSKADFGSLSVNECFAKGGVWNREAHKCAAP